MIELRVEDDPSTWGVALRDYVEALRGAQAEAHRAGQSAVTTSEALSDGIGRALVTLFEHARALGPQDLPPVALVALGSLGRRELAPASDIDVALITKSPDHPGIRELADRLLYPMWDARLEVGHAVRTPAEFARLAKEDDTVRTTAIDWRSLAGDETLNAELSGALRAALGSNRTRRYLARALEQWVGRHSPATVYRLQPNIKTGPGGLRELQRVWWVARLVWRIGGWDELRRRALIDLHDFETLMTGREVLLGIRLAMHFGTGRRQDQLRFDLQDDVAEHVGLQGDGRRSGADQLLQVFYLTAKAVRAAATRILERCSDEITLRRAPRVENIDGFQVFAGRLTLADPMQLEEDPLAAVRIFRVAQSRDLPLHARARARLSNDAARVLGQTGAADPKVSEILLDILGDPQPDGHPTLELMHELGVLECVVPELAPVTGLAQRDIYHTYTVDAHLVYCASRAMAMTVGGVADAPPDIADVARRIPRPHVLVLAALLHDIGKGRGHGHSERGATIAEDVGNRLGLSRRDRDDLSFLVLHHLEMFKLSQRRDLEDPELVQQFASDVENHERLDLLFVLSYCDASTTGPAAWSEWKASLLRELYQRTRRALAGGAARSSVAARALARLEEMSRELDDPAELRWFAERVPPDHLVSYRTELLIRHASALREAEDAGTSASAAMGRHGWELVVVAPDRPGLLADLAAALAAFGLGVDGAYISGTLASPERATMAIDTFAIESGEWPQLEDEGRATELLEALRQAARGDASFEKRLAERRRSRAYLPSGAPLPANRVVYDLDAVGDATVVDVFAPNRVGLLRDVAGAIFEAGATIQVARITTEGERAVDSFYLVDAESGGALDQARREAVERSILERLSGAG